MQPPALLGLLGAALAAAVGSMPVDTRNHNEEMVTRCIIEVLSNALSRSSAPPVTPECRRVLKTRGKEAQDEERNESENTKFEVRLLRDPAEASDAAREAPRSRGSPEARAAPPEPGQDREGGAAEDYPEAEREPERGGETLGAVPADRRGAAAAGAGALRGQHGGRSEERTHSRESGEDGGRAGEPEGSEEAAGAEVAKRRSRPRHHHGRSRPDRAQAGGASSEEGSPDREDAGEARVGAAAAGDTWPRHAAPARASAEQPGYGGELRSHQGGQAPEDPAGERRGGRGSAELRAPGPRGAESREEEAPGPEEEREQGRARQGARGQLPRARAGEPGASAGPGVEEEKRFVGEVPQHGQGGQVDKARRRPQGEWEERDPSRLGYGEGPGGEGAPAWLQGLRDPGEHRGEARRGASAEGESLGPLLSPRYTPGRRGSGLFGRLDSPGDTAAGEEEGRPALDEKRFFPEYSYDWGEQPQAEAGTWGLEKRSAAGAPTVDLQQLYGRVAELDQLLHFRKKAAELPGFHAAGAAEDGPGQGALTAQEEKELENLAAMDLELQKIAEKFGGNWRG